MARILVIADGGFAELFGDSLRHHAAVEACHCVTAEQASHGEGPWSACSSLLAKHDLDTVVYLPPPADRRATTPDLEHARAVLEGCARSRLGKVVLLSSASVYGPHYHNRGLLSENALPPRAHQNAIARQWLALESLACEVLKQSADCALSILRPAAVLARPPASYFSCLFSRRFAVIFAGHDPSIQLLSPEDLARAICCAVGRPGGDTFNVAPAGVIPLRKALRLAGVRAISLPYCLHRLARRMLAPLGLAYPAEQVEYIHYSWTVSNDKSKAELGFVPRHTSAEAILEFCANKPGVRPAPENGDAPSQCFDDFGLDPAYVTAYGRTLFRFLRHQYWRIEARGLSNVPHKGRAVLVGVHRGFMPWDGVMVVNLLAQEIGRIPRFLLHPGLIKFPFLANFHTKLGGVVACKENADYVLERDELLAIYPEGIRGAFTLYRDAYRLGKFGRDEYVRMALRNRAPLIPFVTVGSAETFPILGKIEWAWWKRYTEWPFIPLTPTFPLLPVPLPSKWHMEFLDPIHVERHYGPEAANDEATVRAISEEVRGKLEHAIEWIRSRRKSIFYGSVFNEQPVRNPLINGAPS
jgi:1-acyl-sn-glycerol-3-phosphate acyltransferase/nucleoside-diphosphate-sugar epimerase